MINVNEFKPGITFEDEGNIYVVLTAQHSKQGRGQANVKAKVKNLRTGSTTLKSYTGGDKVQKAHIEKKPMDYLYNDGSNIILMDQESFEQIEIDVKKVEWELNFLTEGMKILVRQYQNEILDIEIPINIELKVINAPDAVKGNTTTNPQKKVIVETGYELEVPMFIKEGETIIVSSETGKYGGKSSK
ncbi:ELONGATION FACTOR P (EF-P) [Mycoplasmopsis pulmonis]|uniref:Elongation factor P n=1 Tax=Mycoplasmopsis pulmonis (strain UAB CTIP) TaxID=272635 RepID=EFP_MYCPU|nr:elongation factor P [Mycoplasmopsis pulmonis]Q98Q55.1 RecName: Full=Elongation factor P; Short=EF-P [Mycoplasmopsis pulmonis UAB CTIP]MDZ7293477.1 elongation factor P [Mycoplasmopsis pulmonis]CAC13686.1 ELONGATION FACTOR P (EF-P) [Mycoplasmopsis pulmonis]VEU68281.1 elongation factor P [Mycoplasmopsis pulmonis]